MLNEQDAPGNHFLPFEMTYLPDFVKKKALVELKETSDAQIEGLRRLKSLISAPESTIFLQFQDDFLQMFLRYSKYDDRRAFVQLKNFIHLKRKYSKLFRSISEDYFHTKPSTGFGSILPYRSPEGCTIILFELGKWDPAELSIDDFKRLSLAIYSQVLRDPMTQINGFKIINDFGGTSVKHLRHCTPQNLHFQYHTAMDCLPGRFKEIHMVNESIFLQVLWAMVRNFISVKIKSRIFFHSEPKDLLNHFPRSILPVQYGGDLVEYSNIERIKKINRDYGNSPMEGDPNYF